MVKLRRHCIEGNLTIEVAVVAVVRSRQPTLGLPRYRNLQDQRQSLFEDIGMDLIY